MESRVVTSKSYAVTPSTSDCLASDYMMQGHEIEPRKTPSHGSLLYAIPASV